MLELLGANQGSIGLDAAIKEDLSILPVLWDEPFELSLRGYRIHKFNERFTLVFRRSETATDFEYIGTYVAFDTAIWWMMENHAKKMVGVSKSHRMGGSVR